MSKVRTQLQELRQKTKEELKNMLEEEREHVRALRFKVHTQEVKQVHTVRVARARIARIMTLLKTMIS